MKSQFCLYFTACLAILASLSTSANALTFTFWESPALRQLQTTNPAQYITILGGYHQAAAEWSARLSSPINVSLLIDAGQFDGGIVGSAASSVLLLPYADVAARLPVLPATPGTFYLGPPGASGVTVDTSLVAVNRANAKALGYSLPDDFIRNQFDGGVTINSLYGFDWDRSDGISGIDGVAVIAHELGHILGFNSSLDFTSGTINPTLMDHFRWGEHGRDLSSSLAPKWFSVDGTPTDLYLTNGYAAYSQQGGHWHESHAHLGVMAPIALAGVSRPITDADAFVLHTMGYERQQAAVGANEPPVFVFVVMALPLVSFARVTRRLLRAPSYPPPTL